MTTSTSSCTTLRPTRSRPRPDRRPHRPPPRTPRGRLHLELPSRPDRPGHAQGSSGYLSKTMPAADLVTALEAITDRQVVITAPGRGRPAIALDWPGRAKVSPIASPRSSRSSPKARNNEIAHHVPEPQHRQVLHSRPLPQDRREAVARRAVGHRARLPARPPPHRPLAGRTVTNSFTTSRHDTVQVAHTAKRKRFAVSVVQTTEEPITPKGVIAEA